MSNAYPNKIHIIGGKWKNKRISLPRNTNIRPTPVRARQVLFNWVNFDIHGMMVLDIFAGSGVLGLEALSRGAASTIFIDQDHQVCSRLRHLCSELQLDADHATIVKADAPRWLQRQQKQWDLVFLDPPFHRSALYSKCLITLRSQLSSNGLIYVESSKRESVDFLDYQVFKSKVIGEVRMDLLRT